MVKKQMLIVKTNKPIGFIITDASGRVLKKGGPTKKLLKEHRKEMAKRRRK